ncbi:hypothetical protein B0H12DRAFT_1091372 [Mycena haematopus]|nr:hypothetical protein B0H12DRAFT_1091372 [Mycena haematopus]
MVAVDHFAVLAFSLASLSLSVDAAAVNARPGSSDPGSPSKPSRQHAARFPMPIKRMANRDPDSDATSKRIKFQKSRVAEADPSLRKAFFKRQQQRQASFHVPRTHAETRDDSDSATSGHVDIKNGTDTIGHLVFNQDTFTLNASNSSMTTLSMVPSGSQASSNGMRSVALQVPVSTSNSTLCATFDPYPSTAKPLTVTDCFDNSTAPNPHASQSFTYNPSTGAIAPTWGDDSASSDTLNSRDTPQNVTLVFVRDPAPVAGEANDQASDSESQSASSVATETVTTTVTATATSSFAVSSTTDTSSSPTLAAAEFDPASSATYSLSQPASPSFATDSSVAPASSSAVPTFGALAVEVVSSSSSYPMASSSVVPSAPESSPAPSATVSTVDAASDPSSVSDPAPSSTLSPDDDSDSSFSGSASATGPSSSASADDSDPTVAPLTNDEQAVYVENARGAPGTPEWR